MNFNSRETYLAAVSIWKATYAEHTINTRKVRNEYKESQRNFTRAGAYDYSQGSYDTDHNIFYRKTEYIMQDLQNQCHSNKAIATKLIGERHSAKEEAGRQMQGNCDH